jgi:hypothetical protein
VFRRIDFLPRLSYRSGKHPRRAADLNPQGKVNKICRFLLNFAGLSHRETLARDDLL